MHLRQVLSLVLIGVSVVVFILIPFLYVGNIIQLWSFDPDLHKWLVSFFQEVYFTVILGMLALGIYLFIQHRIEDSDSKTLTGGDYGWIGASAVALILYVLAYAATEDYASIFKTVYAVIPFLDYGNYYIGDNTSLGVLSPDLHTFVLWMSFFVIVMGVVHLFNSFNRIGLDRKKYGALLINLLIALLLGLFLLKVPAFYILEENAISERYLGMRSFAGRTEFVGGGWELPYCIDPESKRDFENELAAERERVKAEGGFVHEPSGYPIPPGIRDDIAIIGITDRDIEASNNQWPLDWGVYASITDGMSGIEGTTTVFDISFIDEKGVFGGESCGRTISCEPLAGGKARRQVDVLAESVRNSEQLVVADYPVEVSSVSLDKLVDYENRVRVLRERTGIKNVKNGEYAPIQATLPKPPVTSIGEELDTQGFANVFIDPRTKVNRKVPLVLRVPRIERFRTDTYTPVVDDDFFPGMALATTLAYYGVDPVNDVEVDFLNGYVKIKNIPEKFTEELNFDTGQMERIDIMARPNPERTVTIPMDTDGLMNINFRGGRYCFPYHQILPVARGEIDPVEMQKDFEGKIILVAMYYATGVSTAQDIHLSPYGTMAGIEHQAYAINTILNQDFAHSVPPLVNLVILLVIALVTGFFQPRVATWLSIAVSAGIFLIYYVVTVYVSFDIFSYLHILWTVGIEQVLMLIAFVVFRVLAEEENVKFIRGTFSKFVSQDVVDELLANPAAIALGGSKREVSVFFSDVRGFTTISEALGPEELVQLLNEYLSEMTELIIHYRGTIDKYMGDAIMAFWGAPVENPDHAYYTCVAAIAQYRALQTMKTGWAEKGTTQLDIGIGINTGMAVVGNMGSSRRMDYTLMGDTVNLGSRLEGITKTYGVKIVISEFTYERVKDRVWARELDLVQVKGKNEPVRIYELMGLKDDADIERLRDVKESTAAAS